MPVKCLVRKQKPIGRTWTKVKSCISWNGYIHGCEPATCTGTLLAKESVFHYSRINRDWFLAVWRFLHFADNSRLPDRSDPDCDQLFKIRPVITAVNEACLQNYHGSQHQSIDEAMVAFKGRTSMKQYMPMKPTKRVWVRADSANGYVCQFQCYTGKAGNTEVDLGRNVVTTLTRELVGKNYSVYMDNFFSSIELFQRLLDDNIYATGTLRSNKKKISPWPCKSSQMRTCIARQYWSSFVKLKMWL